jgi:hypothetical protein
MLDSNIFYGSTAYKDESSDKNCSFIT